MAELKFRKGDPLKDFYDAVSREGPRAFDWEDKPHRLIYDLIRMVKRERQISRGLRKALMR